MRLKDIIFSFWGSYYREKDSYKDNDPLAQNRGFLQRYYEMIAEEEIDVFILPKINSLVANTILPNEILTDFLNYAEINEGLEQELFTDNRIRRKILPYLNQLHSWRGTKQNFKFLFLQLGFDSVLIDELSDVFDFGLDSQNFLDNPYTNFDTNEERKGLFNINLYGSIDLTDDIWTQIWNIIEFNTPINAILENITYNDIIIYNGIGITTRYLFKTVQAGVQVVTIKSIQRITSKISYLNDNTNETKASTYIEFTKAYANDSEKSFSLDLSNELLLNELVLEGVISDLPNLSNLINLRVLSLSYQKENDTLNFAQYQFLACSVVANSQNNAFVFNSCPNLKEVNISAAQTTINIDNCAGLQKVKHLGMLTSITVQNSGALVTEPLLEISLQNYTFTNFDFLDSNAQANLKKIEIWNVSFENNSVNLQSIAYCKDLIFVIIDNDIIQFDVSQNTFLQKLLIVNLSQKVQINLNSNNQTLLQELTISQRHIDNVSYSNYENIEKIVLQGHKQVDLFNLPQLKYLSAINSTLGQSTTDLINIQNCPKIEYLDFRGNFLGTKTGTIDALRLPNFLLLDNLKEINFQNCNLNRAEIEIILDMILAKEIYGGLDASNLDLDYWSFDLQDFANQNNKILRIDNIQGYTFGNPNSSPNLNGLAKINNLINNYGWSIYYQSGVVIDRAIMTESGKYLKTESGRYLTY